KMEERLIIAVSGFPVLYDVSLFAYRDLNKKNDAWKKVSEIVGVPGKEKRWKNLRDTFRREKNRERERNRSGAGAVSSRPWRYMGVMSFLNPFVESRPTSGNMVVEVEEGQESSDEGTAPSTSGVISGLSPTPLQKKRSPPTEDPDEMFFRSILSDFKSLTERRRDELKFKIHQLIFEAKCQEAEENTKI
uniref:MADF domain-containing protein n=1 Tax=Astyanax mexicanus TaxID=7994 RepID=A0A3B1IUG3_ASTMX